MFQVERNAQRDYLRLFVVTFYKVDMRFHDKNSTNPEIFMKWFISVYIQFLHYETEKSGVFSSAWTSFFKLENSISFTTQIPNSMKFEFECLYFWETQTRWNLKCSKYSTQNLVNSFLNSSLQLKNLFFLNLICVWTRSFQVCYYSNSMKCEHYYLRRFWLHELWKLLSIIMCHKIFQNHLFFQYHITGTVLLENWNTLENKSVLFLKWTSQTLLIRKIIH